VPFYCYSTGSGPVVELMFPMGKAPKTITLDDGVVAGRDFQAERCAFSGTPGQWPIECDASGVHPAQRKAAYQESVRNGVPTLFTDDGRAVLRDKGHRKKYLKSLGIVDRNSYG